MKKKKEKKVIVLLFITSVNIGWDMLERKMEHLKLTETEKELIKQDILHKEAELNRRM